MTTFFVAPPPYPVHELPLVLRDAALELQVNVQAPDALICMSLLSAVSLACQGVIDVKLPTGQVRPCSLNVLCIGESGERKSTVDSLVFEPFYDHDKASALAYHAELLARNQGSSPSPSKEC